MILNSKDYGTVLQYKEFLSFTRNRLQELFYNFPNSENIINYTTHQLAGMKLLYEDYNVRVKLGWITNKDRHCENLSKDYFFPFFKKQKLNEFFF